VSTNKRRAPKVREGRSVIQGHTEGTRYVPMRLLPNGAQCPCLGMPLKTIEWGFLDGF
jgi:hypothetical protein